MSLNSRAPLSPMLCAVKTRIESHYALFLKVEPEILLTRNIQFLQWGVNLQCITKCHYSFIFNYVPCHIIPVFCIVKLLHSAKNALKNSHHWCQVLSVLYLSLKAHKLRWFLLLWLLLNKSVWNVNLWFSNGGGREANSLTWVSSLLNLSIYQSLPLLPDTHSTLSTCP